ncbi:MAG: hypothetical protein ACUVRH_01635 [Candidatus Bipolaricaulia bacterium]
MRRHSSEPVRLKRGAAAPDPRVGPPGGAVPRFDSLEEFASVITGPEFEPRERLKREMFVQIGEEFYKWVGAVCPYSRDHHIVVKGPDGQCYCPHCRSFIEPVWF